MCGLWPDEKIYQRNVCGVCPSSYLESPHIRPDKMTGCGQTRRYQCNVRGVCRSMSIMILSLESPHTILGYITYYDSITLKAAFCVLCNRKSLSLDFQTKHQAKYKLSQPCCLSDPPPYWHCSVPRLWVAELVMREKCLSRYVCAMIDSLIDSMFDTRTSMRCIHSPRNFIVLCAF